MGLGRSAGILRKPRWVSGFDGLLVGGVDGQPRPENPHEYWASSCYKAPVKWRKERFLAGKSAENARTVGKRNTARRPQPAPTLASVAEKEKASTRLASSKWWAPRESNPAPTDYESAALTKHELEAPNRSGHPPHRLVNFTLHAGAVWPDQ